MFSFHRPLLLRLLATALITLLTLVHGTTITPFSGLPLSPWESLFVIGFLTLIWSTTWYVSKILRATILLSLTLLLTLQPIGEHYIPAGWSVCLKRAVALDKLTTPCEPTAQFRRGQLSYLLPAIRWHDQFFPLHFMNDVRSFNFHEPGEPDQRHLPYTMSADAFFQPNHASPLTLSSSFPAAMTVNNQFYSVLPRQPLTIVLPARQLSHVRLDYSSRNQPDQFFRVDTNAQPYFTRSIPPLGLSYLYRSLSWALLLIFFLSTAAVLLNSLLQLRVVFSLGLLLLLPVYSLLPAHPRLIHLFYPLSVLILSWLLTTLSASYRRIYLPLFLILLLLVTNRYVSYNTPPQSFYIGTVGRDTLSHLSVARDQINWQQYSAFIGRNLFYLQPMHRYLLALPLKTLGESLWGAYLIQTYLAALAVALTLCLLVKFSRPTAGLLFSLLFLALNGFGQVAYPWLSPFYISTTTYQQGMAVPLIILAALLIYSLFLSPTFSLKRHFFVGLAISLALMTRMDYLPLLGLIIIYSLFLPYRVALPRALLIITSLLLALAVFPTLIVTKNYLATGLWRLSPTSTTMNQYGGFYHIIPYASDPLPATAMLYRITSWYRGHYLDLAQVLYQNLRDNFIGQVIFRQILWYTSPLLVLVALRQGSAKEKHLTLLLLFSFLPVVGFNLFFRLHPASFDMHIIFDYWLLIIASIGLSIILQRPAHNTTAVIPPI